MLEKKKKRQCYYETVWAKCFITITCTASNETSTWRFIINDSSCYFLVDVILASKCFTFSSPPNNMRDIFMMRCGSILNLISSSSSFYEMSETDGHVRK